jgi:D-alanyl-D-alanine carboxypeptidase (penicillin-binding protein 5/6)
MKRLLYTLVAFAIAIPLLAQQDEGGGMAKGAAVDTTGKGYTAAYVIEPATKRVLFAENEHVPLPTASMAKMMTALITMEEIRDGRLKLDSPVTTSARASKMGGSQIFARDGQVFTVQTLLAALMIQSANDAAEALAEKIAGSAENFADIMNQRAKALGLKESTFYDPHGLPNSANPNAIDKESAYDLAMVAIELMKYPLMKQYAATPHMDFANGTFTAGLTNPNHLIQPGKQDYYDAANGIKTGYSAPAGYCVTASAKRGDLELIAVVMGARAPHGPMSSFGIASKLLSSAFAQHSMATVLKKGTIVGQANVTEGAAKTVSAVASSDVKALVKRGEEAGVKVSFTGSQVVTAPVRAGQPVGTITVAQAGQVIAKVPAVAGAAVDKQPWWRKFWPF